VSDTSLRAEQLNQLLHQIKAGQRTIRIEYGLLREVLLHRVADLEARFDARLDEHAFRTDESRARAGRGIEERLERIERLLQDLRS